MKYARHRLIRLSDSTENIAGGLALGAAMSFSPLLGTHIVQCAGICFFTRLNMLASFAGTMIGNPWTFPFIWWASLSLGNFLMELAGFPSSASLPEGAGFSVIWDMVKHEPLRVFLPWLLGGYILALVSWPVFYFLFYEFIHGAKLAREKLRKARQKKEKK